MLSFIKSNGHRWRLLSIFFLTASIFVLAAQLSLFDNDRFLTKTIFPSSQNQGDGTPLPIPGYHNYTSPYSFDCNAAKNPAWMAELPDETNLTALSIPGTHDTMTYAMTHPVFQCQNYDLYTQLAAGMRYLDIRARLNSNELIIYHGNGYTGFSFADVLGIVFGFLDQYPSETVIMRLKEEAEAIDSTIEFETAFNFYRFNDSETKAGCEKHLWQPDTPQMSLIPDLGTLRGKVMILQQFGELPAAYGVGWDSPLLAIEDDWIMENLTALDRKFDNIINGLEGAAKSADGRLYLSHTSASVGVLPIVAAAGTLSHNVTGMNDRTGEWLREGKFKGTTGVVIMDFPGQALIEQVLDQNR